MEDVQFSRNALHKKRSRVIKLIKKLAIVWGSYKFPLNLCCETKPVKLIIPTIYIYKIMPKRKNTKRGKKAQARQPPPILKLHYNNN